MFDLDQILSASSGTHAGHRRHRAGEHRKRIHSAAAALSALILPPATSLHAGSILHRVDRLYARAARFTALFIVTVSAGPLILARPGLAVQIGSQFADAGGTAFRVIVATYAVLSVGAVPYLIALALDRPGVTVLRTA